MRFFDIIAKQLLSLISNLSDVLEMITKWPFKGLRSGAGKSPIWMLPLKLLWLPIALFSFLLNLPLRFYRNSSMENKKDLLLGLPAVAMAILVVFVFLSIAIRSEKIEQGYRSRAQQAMNRGDLELAKTIYGRLVIGNDDPDNGDLLAWAIILNTNKEYDRSLAIINQLAPDDKVGYKPAHELKAILLARSIGANADPEVLKNLQWHLGHAEEQESAAILGAKVTLFEALQKLDKAAFNLEKAVELNPTLLLKLSKLYRQIDGPDNTQRADRALNQARQHFDPLLAENPLDENIRIFVALVMAEQDELDSAEKVLLEGNRILPTDKTRRAIAGFYLRQYDELVAEDKTLNEEEFKKRLAILQRSLFFETNNFATYNRLIELYEKSKTDEKARDELKQLLEKTIASGEAAELAHFSLGNILWMEEDFENGRMHMELSYKINPRFLAVANNLAWTLAKSEPKDLERAETLSESVVKASPDDARFRDTYANVLKEMGKLNEALEQFEIILRDPGLLKDLRPVYSNLAEIYEKLGRDSLAEEYRNKAMGPQTPANQSKK